MKRHFLEKAPKLIVIGIAAIGVLGFVVMSLWNWLMPAVFGLHTIGFWQALGLWFLSALFFGSFRGHRGGRGGPRGDWRHRMKERLEGMTPEEREKFLQGMQGRCGPFRGPATHQQG